MPSSAAYPAAQLAEECQLASHLVALLQQEQACLIQADIDGLTGLTEQKSKAVATLSELAAARHHSLASLAFPANETGMQQWLSTASPTSREKRSWEELLEKMQAAKELNRTNGILIHTHMARNQSALHVLHGNAPHAQGSTLYGPNGQSTAKPVGRGLVVG